MFTSLPNELIIQFCDHLNAKDICNLSQSGTACRHLQTDDLVWRRLTNESFAKGEKCKILKDVICKLGERYGWRLCYETFHRLKFKLHAYFWNDEHFSGDATNINTVVSKILLKVLLNEFNPIEGVSCLLATEPKPAFCDVIKTLLDAGEGPIASLSMITSPMLQRLTMIVKTSTRIIQLGISNASQTIQLERQAEGFFEFLKSQELVSKPPFSVVKAMQSIVLTMIRAILTQCNPGDERERIDTLLQSSFHMKTRWHASMSDSMFSVMRSSPSLSIEILHVNIFDYLNQPRRCALYMTYEDQIQLTQLNLQEYLDSALRRRTDYTCYFRQDNVKDIKMIQQEKKTSTIVNYFCADEGHQSAKVHLIYRLIDTAQELLALNNFASFKSVLTAVRGVLTFRHSTGLSWKDISYSYLKKFVDLEAHLPGDVERYKKKVFGCSTHCIPVLSVHLEEVKCLLERRKRKQKVSTYLQFDDERNKEVALSTARLYATFTNM